MCDIGGLDSDDAVHLHRGREQRCGRLACVTCERTGGAGAVESCAPGAASARAVPAFEPVVAFDLDGPGAATVEIPGYVALPQGRIEVENPNGHPIAIRGGILAAEISVVDSRPAPVPIGFEKLEVQHKLRIVSTNAQGPERSIAIVQVNQNGGNAVNSWEVQ